MRKNGDTKAAMADALRVAMQETPIDRISIKNITDACGLNRQTFYYHFKDIYDLVKWMYVRNIDKAVQSSVESDNWQEGLRQLLNAFDCERDCHLAIYNSRNYYPNLRQEILDSLTTQCEPLFRERFNELGLDEHYREFLLRMYGLIIFEFVERHARGVSFSTIDEFVDSWFRTVACQFEGERSRQASRV